MAQIDLGKIKPIWKGAWVGSTAYEKNDMVSEGNNSYICTAAHTAHASTFSNDSANWDIMATGSNIPSQTGNSGKVLKTDGSALSWGDDQGGSMVKILKYTISTPTTYVDIDNIFSSAYKQYKVIIRNLVPQTNSSQTELRFLSSGAQQNAGNYKGATAGAEAYSGPAGNNTQYRVRYNQDSFQITHAGGNASNSTTNGGQNYELNFFDPHSTTTKKLFNGIYVAQRETDTNIHVGHLGGIYDTANTTAMTGIRIWGGTPVAGEITVYGIVE